MDKKKSKSMHISYVSLLCLIRGLVRHLWMIIAAALVCSMTVSLIMAWFHTPLYKATMTYAVNAKTTSYISSGNLTSTREVASVLSELLGTDLIDDEIRAADPRLTNFNGTISAAQVGDSNFIIVSATATTPEDAFLALSALVDVFPKVADFISTRNVLNVMQNPSVSSVPSNQLDSTKIARTAALLGAFLMAALICYFSFTSETIQTRTGARQMLDAPIIATICHEQKNRTLKTLLQQANKEVHVLSPTTSFAYTEQISTICSHLEHESTARGRKVFLISGVGENEGKSTVAGNVAAALALKGHHVAVVDCDLRKPALNRFFAGQYNSPLPLNKLLAQPYSRDNLLQCMVPHSELSMYMLFPVNSDTKSSELLSGSTMASVIQQLRVFDFVIVDSPPMGMFPDAEIVADLVDGSMLVVRQDYTAACDVNDAVDTLKKYKGAFLGVILNDMMSLNNSRYGYGGKYGYGTHLTHEEKFGHKHRSHSSERTKSSSKDS